MQLHEFWVDLDRLVETCPVVIDRLKGTRHPHYPDIVYPLDYGYLQGSTTVDGGGIDIWVGSLPGKPLTGIVLTVDLHKRDIEIKLLLGCDPAEQQIILNFHNDGLMHATLFSLDIIIS